MIPCKECKRKMRCLETRFTHTGVYRRYKCSCNYRVSTREVPLAAGHTAQVIETKVLSKVRDALDQLNSAMSSLS